MAAQPAQQGLQDVAPPLLEVALKSVIDITLEGYKQLGLMHGGAIVAIVTFAGHGGAKYPLPALLACAGFFALGLWFNVESMQRARETQLAMFNREWMRGWVTYFLSVGDAVNAQPRADQAEAFNGQVEHFTRDAIRLFNWSLAAFIAGSAVTIAAVVLYG